MSSRGAAGGPVFLVQYAPETKVVSATLHYLTEISCVLDAIS